jgi:hypothetical protein
MTDRSRGARSAAGPLSVVGAVLGHGDVAALRPTAREWALAAELAGWHGLQAALHDALARRDLLGVVPPMLRHALEVARVVAELRAEARRRQLGEILATLRAIDVSAIALKGAYVAERLYAAPALRPMSDLDLLLADVDVPRARDALHASGYASDATPSPARHAPALRRAGGIPVELHRAIEPCTPPFALPLDGIWRRATRTTVAGTDAYGLAPEDLLLHLATHMAHSHVLGASLTSVHDVHRWCTVFGATADWDAIARRARLARVHGFVHAALSLARHAFGAEVPRAPLTALCASESGDAVVAHALALLAAPPFVIVGAKAVTDPRDDWPARARRIVRALLVSPARGPLGPRLAARAGADDGRAAARDGYAARWGALLRLLAAPAAGWEAARQVVRVRALRRWASAPGAR